MINVTDMTPPQTFVKGRTIIFNYMQSCMQKNEKKHEKWDCGSQA